LLPPPPPAGGDHQKTSGGPTRVGRRFRRAGWQRRQEAWWAPAPGGRDARSHCPPAPPHGCGLMPGPSTRWAPRILLQWFRRRHSDEAAAVDREARPSVVRSLAQATASRQHYSQLGDCGSIPAPELGACSAGRKVQGSKCPNSGVDNAFGQEMADFPARQSLSARLHVLVWLWGFLPPASAAAAPRPQFSSFQRQPRELTSSLSAHQTLGRAPSSTHQTTERLQRRRPRRRCWQRPPPSPLCR
jgi:hypothetical protein